VDELPCEIEAARGLWNLDGFQAERGGKRAWGEAAGAGGLAADEQVFIGAGSVEERGGGGRGPSRGVGQGIEVLAGGNEGLDGRGGRMSEEGRLTEDPCGEWREFRGTGELVLAESVESPEQIALEGFGESGCGAGGEMAVSRGKVSAGVRRSSESSFSDESSSSDDSSSSQSLS
jgi:hypothetical protein